MKKKHLHQPILKYLLVLAGVLLLLSVYKFWPTPSPRRTLYHVGDIVKTETDSGEPAFAFTTKIVPREDIVGAVYIRWPNGFGKEGGFLILNINGRMLSDEAEVSVWRDRMRAHAEELRREGDMEAERLEQYASMPLK